ncbi:MAG: lysylphosphatidylglycerol synthase transmembrane domain-containing protein [Terriglobia bacterium]
MSTRSKALLATTLALAGLTYLVLRASASPEWQEFEWEDFWQSLLGLRLPYLLLAAALIFSSYLFRSFRWREFLRPMKSAGLQNILVSTLVGFSAVALLGRPGEVVRPWLVARKEGLTVSSQLAAWTLERVFDSLTVAGFLGLALYFPSADAGFGESHEPLLQHFRQAGLVLFAGAVALGIAVSQFRRRKQFILAALAWLTRPLPARHREHLARIADSFATGLAGIENIRSLLVCAGFSWLVWLSIVAAYWSAMQALGEPVARLDASALVLVMAATIVGSVAHLPGVGGGQQVAIALTLTQLFGIPLAIATSAALLLWFLCFMMVLIPGLPLTAHEGLTWQRLRSVVKEGL